MSRMPPKRRAAWFGWLRGHSHLSERPAWVRGVLPPTPPPPWTWPDPPGLVVWGLSPAANRPGNWQLDEQATGRCNRPYKAARCLHLGILPSWKVPCRRRQPNAGFGGTAFPKARALPGGMPHARCPVALGKCICRNGCQCTQPIRTSKSGPATRGALLLALCPQVCPCYRSRLPPGGPLY